MNKLNRIQETIEIWGFDQAFNEAELNDPESLGLVERLYNDFLRAVESAGRQEGHTYCNTCKDSVDSEDVVRHFEQTHLELGQQVAANARTLKEGDLI